MLIAYVEHPDTATYSWEYVGGCYDNSEPTLYEIAEEGTTYDFTFVPFEVREDTSWAQSIESEGETLFWSLGTLFAILGFLSILAAVGCVIMFLY
jgi:hypothetical protein